MPATGSPVTIRRTVAATLSGLYMVPVGLTMTSINALRILVPMWSLKQDPTSMSLSAWLMSPLLAIGFIVVLKSMRHYWAVRGSLPSQAGRDGLMR